MSSTTTNLGLFKYDVTTDGKEVFSIQSALNDNWDKIDSACGSNLTAQVEPSEGTIFFQNLTGQYAAARTYTKSTLSNMLSKFDSNTYVWGTTQSGYIKTSRGSCLIQWGVYMSGGTGETTSIGFPVAFAYPPIIVTQGSVYANAAFMALLYPTSITTTGFTRSMAAGTPYSFYWIAIGIAPDSEG